MKIVHIITGLRVGGAERFLQRMILVSQSDPTIRHVVVSLVELGPIGRELRDAGIEVHAIGVSGALSLLKGFPRLVSLIRGIGPDIVQTWMYHADIVGGLAAKLAGNPPIAWNIRVAIGPLKLRTRMLVRLAAVLSKLIPDRIICCGKVVAQDHAEIGYETGKMVIVPNGYDLAKWALSDAERSARGTANISILSVGRFDPQKGYGYLVEAAALLKDRGRNFRFVLAGSGCDPDNEELAKLLRTHSVADRFELLGVQQDVRALYARASVFCLSSLFEGFPNVVAEAMAMELPCVATDAGDARMVLGECGEIVPPGEAVSLAGALDRAGSMAAGQREALGKRARQRIEGNFSLDRAWSQYRDLYGAMLSEAS